jgi:hypothetical protein
LLSTPVRKYDDVFRLSGSGGLVLMELELGKKLLEISTRELPLEWSSRLLISLLKSKKAVLALRN